MLHANLCRLVMGTRSGDVDPGLLPFLAAQGMGLQEVDGLLNKRSGLLGLSGHSDWRAVHAGAQQGDERCLLAAGVRCCHQPSTARYL